MNQGVSRGTAVCVLLAAAVAGLLFQPVFGLAPLLRPIAVVAVAGYLAVELALRFPVLVPWRPLLGLLLGLVGLGATELWPSTVGGLPTGETARALLAGVTQSWQLTLQSTWPARPDAELLLFVPIAVLLAAVLAVELLRWPLVALLPSLLVAALSQAYVAQTGVPAIIAALAYAAVAAALLVSARRGAQDADGPRPRRRIGAVALAVLPTVLLAVLAAALVTTADPVAPKLALQHGQSVPLPPDRVVNPLDGIAGQLQRPDQPVFSYTAADPVDRWRVVVLAGFDGVNWTQEPQWHRMGATLAPTATVPTSRHAATVTVPGVDQPWLPSQEQLAGVDGVAPLLDPDTGMLVLTGRTGPVRYDMSWWEPPDTVDLAGAAVDGRATAGFDGLGAVPAGIRELALKAVSDTRPSFQTALVLERYLSENYQVAQGKDLPTGSGWPQLTRFLLQDKRGTSEQFAASYVVLARLIGIPARLVVGYRPPSPGPDGTVVVRNENVLAWPEVAVAGVGWVPLDPTRLAKGAGPVTGGLAAATARARVNLPPPAQVQQPQLPPTEQDDEQAPADSGVSFPWLLVGLVVLGVAVLAVLAVPVVIWVRMVRRRRLVGPPGVVAAWREARDRLRAHGVPFAAGMTVRDLATAAEPVVDRSVVDGLHSLATHVDLALWAPVETDERSTGAAWQAVSTIRKGLARGSLQARLRAAFDPSTLRTP